MSLANFFFFSPQRAAGSFFSFLFFKLVYFFHVFTEFFEFSFFSFFFSPFVVVYPAIARNKDFLSRRSQFSWRDQERPAVPEHHECRKDQIPTEIVFHVIPP